MNKYNLKKRRKTIGFYALTGIAATEKGSKAGNYVIMVIFLRTHKAKKYPVKKEKRGLLSVHI